MKKSYIVLIILAVFGAGAIALWPTKTESTAITYEQSAVANDNSASPQPNTTGAAQAAPSGTNKQPADNANILKDGTHKGTTETTPYGDLQIAIVVSDGKISNVTFLTMPQDDKRSALISDQTSPQLKAQTITAQSASIDGVSGATYTSDAYIGSLQAAIDAANGA